ncbi:MAG: hypothetical protein H7329_13115 [Opitutaceae bacterium]|nr:hypothetical protein [Cytophagales bacterium]
MVSVYSEKDFIKLINNKRQSDQVTDPEEVIKAHKEIFEFMEKLPGTFCFIYDFFNFKYILVSKSIRSIIGQSEDVLLKGGFQECLKYFHPEDKENIAFIHQKLFSFLHSQNAEELKEFRFDFNYRVLNAKGNYIQLLQQSAFTTILDGKPLYDFSTCTDVTQQKRNSRMELNIYRLDENNSYNLIYEYVVPGTIGFGVSISEFKILKMAADGMSSRDIAEKSCRSIHTINNQRRSILSKTKSNTLAEAMLKIEI